MIAVCCHKITYVASGSGVPSTFYKFFVDFDRQHFDMIATMSQHKRYRDIVYSKFFEKWAKLKTKIQARTSVIETDSEF